MKSRRWLVGVLGVLGVVVLSACSSLATPEADSSDAQAVVADELALDGALLEDLAAGTLSAGAQGVDTQALLPGFPRPVARLLRHWRIRLASLDFGTGTGQCQAEIKSGTDADGDGIVSGFSMTFTNCSATTDDGHTATFAGTLTYSDTNDNDSNVKGRTMTFTNFQATISGTNARGEAFSRSRTWDGSVTVDEGAGGAVTITKNMTVNITVSRDGQVVHETATTIDRTTTYTPDDPASPRDAGTLEVTGTVDMTRDGTNFVFNVATDPGDPLHWSKSCAQQQDYFPGFDSGTVVYTYTTNGQVTKTITVTYQGCGQANINVSF